MDYVLKQASEKDYRFLLEVHHKTLHENIAKIWGWDPILQNNMFKKSFNSNSIRLILVENDPVGYLQTYITDNSYSIANILILEEFQNKV